MPQAAVTAIGAYLAAAGVSAVTAFFVEAFIYVAASYLLNRASAALAPNRRSNGLGTADPANAYALRGARIIEGRAYG